MKTIILSVLAALFVHGLLLLFGGVFFFTDKETKSREPIREVELFSDETEVKTEELEPEKDKEKQPEPEIKVEDEKPPEMAESISKEPPSPTLESPTDAIARLDAMSLNALESALSGGSGGDSFGGRGGSLASGGRIGGTGTPGQSELWNLICLPCGVIGCP